MSNNNLEEDNEVLITESDFPTSYLSSAQYHNSTKEMRIRQDTKENDMSLSLFATGKVNFNDVNSPKLFGDSKQFADKKNNDAKKKEFVQTIKEAQSPNSLNSSDLSYKILNEILNTHYEDRSQTRLKPGNKTIEVKKEFPKFNKTLESNTELIANANTKPFFVGNEELKAIQEKIKSLTNQLQNKQTLLESRKKNIEREHIHLQYFIR